MIKSTITRFVFLIIIMALGLSACKIAMADTAQDEMQTMIAELHAIKKQTMTGRDLEEPLKLRAKIIKRFVEIGSPAMPILIGALDDTTRYGFVRRSAAEAIGKINDPASISSLHKLLKKGNVSQRQGAVEALGNLKSRSSVKPLIKLLNRDSDSGVRMLSAISLGRIGDVSAINSLVHRLEKENDPNIRAYGAMALGELKATTKIQLLLSLFEKEHQKSPGSFVAEHYEQALRLITNAKVEYYGRSHVTKEEQDKVVKEWREWWEHEGKLKYPQR